MHSFGWGRRKCLGQHLVDNEMFVTGAGVLWAFNLERKTCPKTGEVIEFDSEATNSHVILEPLPFPCDIRPRSAQRAKLVLRLYEKVRGELRA